MSQPKRAKRHYVEIVDYVAAIDRTALSYSRSHHHMKWEKLRPNRRSLHLYGHMLLPSRLSGLEFEAALYGDGRLAEEMDNVDSLNVAFLQKHGLTVHLTAQVPLDFVPALSSAYHDRRLSLCVGRGPPTRHGKTLLINLDFENHARFESYWGEPLPQPPLRARRPEPDI